MNDLLKQELKLLFPRLIQIRKESKKTLLSTAIDYTKLKFKTGLEFNEYYRYEFDRMSSTLKNNFLSKIEEIKYLSRLNERKYFILGRNKFVTNTLLERLSIPTTKQFLYYDPAAARSNEVIVNNPDDAERIFRGLNINSCIYKFTEGYHGVGVEKIVEIDKSQSKMVLINATNKRNTLDQILSKYPLLFEEVLTQTDQLAAPNPESVNALRALTCLYPNNRVEVVATFLKYGRKGNFINNSNQGGNIIVPINKETGEAFSPWKFESFRNLIPITHHPDSGVDLVNLKIDRWKDIIEEIKSFQAKFPFLKSIGWDIALTNNGPVVIEINDLWDNTGQYFLKTGWREEIKKCYDSWGFNNPIH
jgi:hypothetical protein